MDALPKYQDLIEPMIRVLCNAGKPLTNSEIEAGIINKLEISNELATLIHSGKRTELQYRLAWARTKAKSSGFVSNPAREIWKVTTQGKSLFSA